MLPEIMNPRPTGGRPGREPGTTHQAVERPVDVAVPQSSPNEGHEQGGGVCSGAGAISPLQILAERSDGAGMHRQLS